MYLAKSCGFRNILLNRHYKGYILPYTVNLVMTSEISCNMKISQYILLENTELDLNCKRVVQVKVATFNGFFTCNQIMNIV